MEQTQAVPKTAITGTGRAHQSNAINPKGVTEGGLLGTTSTF